MFVHHLFASHIRWRLMNILELEPKWKSTIKPNPLTKSKFVICKCVAFTLHILHVIIYHRRKLEMLCGRLSSLKLIKLNSYLVDFVVWTLHAWYHRFHLFSMYDSIVFLLALLIMIVHVVVYLVVLVPAVDLRLWKNKNNHKNHIFFKRKANKWFQLDDISSLVHIEHKIYKQIWTRTARDDR